MLREKLRDVGSSSCPRYSGTPPSPSSFILEPIVDPTFPLPGLDEPPAMNPVLVVQDSPESAAAEQNNAFAD